MVENEKIRKMNSEFIRFSARSKFHNFFIYRESLFYARLLC